MPVVCAWALAPRRPRSAFPNTATSSADAAVSVVDSAGAWSSQSYNGASSLAPPLVGPWTTNLVLWSRAAHSFDGDASSAGQLMTTRHHSRRFLGIQCFPYNIKSF